jgi:CRISPR-associated protein Cmr3
MEFKIIPNDILFFRNEKPYDTGESTYAETMDMFYPSTVYGALRSKILFDYCKDYGKFKSGKAGRLTEVIGTPQRYGSLRIEALGLWKNDKPYFPVPEDLVKGKSETEDEEKIFSLTMIKSDQWQSNLPVEYSLISQNSNRVEPPQCSYISNLQLEWYLNSELDNKLTDNKEEFFEKEYRTGILMDFNRRNAEEGYLYTRDVLRFMNGCGFYIKTKGEDDLLAKDSLIKLGGDMRSCELKYLNNTGEIELKDETKEKIIDTGLFKIYLMTPAIFKKGWLPENTNSSLEWELSDNLKAKILTAAVGKYDTASGWDIASNSPKTGYRTVPAGSVYYCKALNDLTASIIEDLNGSTVSDVKSKEGFGIIYIGGIMDV